MENQPKKNRRLDVIISLILVVALIGGAVWMNYQRNKPVQLQGTEVREYQGQQLSSVATDLKNNSIKGTQHIDQATYRLQVTGLVDYSLSVTYDQLLNSYPSVQKVVTLFCVEGWDAKILWQGLLIKDLLAQAGIRGDANTVIFHAVDGYTTSLPIDYLLSNNIMLAYKMNGVTIPPERGFPLQLVAESKWGYKWIKWITEIELSSDPNFQGYWESRGYSDSGNLSENFFK